jgi:hypothetical protein
MHTIFRVYGNAIGRTAICSRTVGRGFKSVSRIIGRGPDDDRRNAENKRAIAMAEYERKEYMKTLTPEQKKKFLQQEKEAKQAVQNRLVDERIGIKHSDPDEEKHAPTEHDIVARQTAAKKLAKEKRAQTLAEAKAFAERLKEGVDAMELAQQLAKQESDAIASEKDQAVKKLEDLDLIRRQQVSEAKSIKLANENRIRDEQEKVMELAQRLAEQKKALQEKEQQEKDEAKRKLITTHNARIQDEQKDLDLISRQQVSEAKSIKLANDNRIRDEQEKAQPINDVIIIDSESDEDEGSDTQSVMSGGYQGSEISDDEADQTALDTHIEQIGIAEDMHEIRQTEINVLSVRIDAMRNSLVDDVSQKKIKTGTKEHNDRTEAIKEMKKILSQLIRTDRVQTYGDLNRIDEGFTEIAKITEHWEKMQERLQKLDNEFIYNTHIDGIFQPVQSDFQMIQFKSKANAKKQADAIIDEEVSKDYLETHSDFTKQNEKILYTDKGTIVPSKKFEFGFCGKKKFERKKNNANQQAVSALFNNDTNFETTDAFCIANKIPGSSSTPIDLFDKLRKRMLECKFYESENFVKMYNCNMIDQTDYYFTLKALLYDVLKVIFRNELKNIIDKESITERNRLLQILRTKNDFLRSYYANREYLSINVSANKWAVVPNVRILANNQTQINNFIRHANTKTTVEYNAARQITGWTARQGNFEVVNDKYKRLLFTDDKEHINYDYYITTMFNGYVGLYDFTHDTLLDGYRHIIEVYKVGPATDQRNTKKVRGFSVVNELMDSIKIPIEKFYNESMFEPYVLPQSKVKKDKKVKAI